MKWVRNEAAESFFERNKIPFRFVEGLPFNDVNMKGCLKTQSRVLTERLNQDVVMQYAMNMLDGSAFHAPVLCKNGKGYISPDGLHRLSAFEESGLAKQDGKLNAYVLDTDDEMDIALVTRCMNRINGWQQSKEEAVQQAMTMLDTYPSLTQQQVAREFGLSPSVVSKAIHAREAARVLEERHVKHQQLSTSVLVELSKLARSEPVLAVVGDIASRHGLTTDQVKRLVDTAKSERSEEKAIAAVEAIEDELQKNQPKPIERSNPVRSRFMGVLNTLFGIVCKHPTLEHLQLTSKSDAAEARRAYERVRGILDVAFGVGK